MDFFVVMAITVKGENLFHARTKNMQNGGNGYYSTWERWLDSANVCTDIEGACFEMTRLDTSRDDIATTGIYKVHFAPVVNPEPIEV